MTYETAKRLKDAGFEQVWHEYDDFIRPEVVSKPTLSELIEACGKDFLHLTHAFPNSSEPWTCDSYLIDPDTDDGYHSRGSTPKEAVANLWLALNEKKA